MEDWMKERYELACGRIREIVTEKDVQEPYLDYFTKMAEFLVQTIAVMDGYDRNASLEEMKKQNRALYEDILPENYAVSYGNPAYAIQKTGEYGQVFSFLYAELRGTIVYAFEKRIWDFTVALELFLEIYAAFRDEEIPEVKAIRDILKSYVNDYCQSMVEYRIRGAIDPRLDFAVRLIEEEDLADIRYLYSFGEYITENEIGVAEFFNSLSEEEVQSIARTYTEGFRLGFAVAKKDLSKKKTVNIRYHLGFERMVKAAVAQFREMGLEATISRYATHAVNKKNHYRTGFCGAIANEQYDYDHKDDHALFLDSDFVQKKLRSTRDAYEKYKDLAAVHGGPAVIETFGENPFTPASKKEAMLLSETQRKQQRDMDNEMGQIVNRYIHAEERSFTIIAYPLPEIGEKFQEIFRETIKINNLDYRKYQRIQQTLIDTLDAWEWVEIKGMNGNETNLRIHLHELADPEHQTNFENCLADMNIPVGEVFTSPVLEGTDGILHVKKVYLNGLQFVDLKLVFSGGQIKEYSCGNFENEEENRRYIEDNILFHHETLPIGEFAIGTNTTAYVTTQKYQIADKMPILIAEKMGPHFAVGDTCYSWEEEYAVYNPDGKEVIARENEISALRTEDISKAYFGCHTDITIPYEELGSICAVDGKGSAVSIIEDGRFVLSGIEELNEPFGTQG